MATSVDLHYPADAEVLAARRRYARTAGGAVAARFLAALDDAKARVSANPSLWSPDQYGTRACRLKKFPCRLIYVEEPARVLVLAVAHDKRRPGYWARRLPP
jgi:plasmid stabilization system protein ParE